MSKVSVSFRTDDAKIKQLDEYARSSRRDRTQLIDEALDHYLFLQEQNLKKIDDGLRDYAAGEFATEKEVQAEFAKWRNL